ncbi:uncharacterized protein LOC105173347 [Sesamum indicum]|uniref:Uncharacterized protein LOC105173347 n=1 Tax=Sesamum indicum TaxID=4182 RepID=A0A6I9U7P3_SESIN|nr:uncharacterized protein LOC105173347 [Sesamum indicum]
MSQLASSVSSLESKGEFPSQTIINSKQNGNAITLYSGKELQLENSTRRGHEQQDKIKAALEILLKKAKKSNQVSKESPKMFVPKPPFPERFAKSKEEEEEKEILETLLKVEIIIEKAICNLGASINIMPLIIYESLDVSPLKEMGVVLQLANHSVVYPEGVLEDVLVQVNELVFPTDFYVLDMRGHISPNSTSIFLGRRFLETSKIKIDVDAGILSMEFDKEVMVNMHHPTVRRAHA